jgi:hypothetical protein
VAGASDDPDLASYLRIDERELGGGLNRRYVERREFGNEDLR